MQYNFDPIQAPQFAVIISSSPAQYIRCGKQWQRVVNGNNCNNTIQSCAKTLTLEAQLGLRRSP